MADIKVGDWVAVQPRHVRDDSDWFVYVGAKRASDTPIVLQVIGLAFDRVVVSVNLKDKGYVYLDKAQLLDGSQVLKSVSKADLGDGCGEPTEPSSPDLWANNHKYVVNEDWWCGYRLTGPLGMCDVYPMLPTVARDIETTRVVTVIDYKPTTLGFIKVLYDNKFYVIKASALGAHQGIDNKITIDCGRVYVFNGVNLVVAQDGYVNTPATELVSVFFKGQWQRVTAGALKPVDEVSDLK